MCYISTTIKDNDVLVWERDPATGERKEQFFQAPYYFYYDDPNGKYTTIYGTKVSKKECNDKQAFYQAKKKFEEMKPAPKLWESDIGPEQRVLSNHYYGIAAPKLNITHLDIEVNYDREIGFSNPQNPYAPINAVAFFHEHHNKLVTLAVPPDGQEYWTSDMLTEECNKTVPLPTNDYDIEIIICKNEKELLLNLLDEIYDSDILSGWNSNLFDFPYIAKRIQAVLGEKAIRYLSFPNGTIPVYKDVEVMGNAFITLETSGRLLADYMMLYKKYEVADKPSFKLSAIEEEVGLNLPKLEYNGTLYDLYRKDFAHFIRYNIRDVEILHGFEKKLAYIELANQMYHMSTGQFQHVGGTLKLAELAITNYCHHTLKQVVNNITPPEIDRQIEGALVLLPQTGMHDWIGSVDINSLYPSSIRACNISMETIRGQFNENQQATREIAKNNKFCQLTAELYSNNKKITMSAADWRDYLLERNWAISGYGTIFDQTIQGIIPTILADWYAQRKRYQKLKKEAEQKAADILKKYETCK